MENIEKIKQSIELLKPNNELYEIRILQTSGKFKTTISGYFKGTKNLEKAFKTVDLRRANVFFTLQKVDDVCYAMEQHEQFLQVKDTTSDKDITDYEWLLVDVDPKRKSGVSSTDAELKNAEAISDRVAEFLENMGFYDPIRAKSGNGCHLLYKIDLPKTDENEMLIKKCLQSLDYLFTNDTCEIDKSVYNPARICKLYGTMARKGADTENRPHRLSELSMVPDEVCATEQAKLEELAAIMPEPEAKAPAKIQKHKGDFDIEQWLSDHMIGVNRVNHTSDGAVKYVLDECPFNSSHKAPDSMVIVQPSGAIGFRCLHNSCMGKTWQELRLMYEPDAYDDKDAEIDKRMNEGWAEHKKYLITQETEDKEKVKKSVPVLQGISAQDLQGKEFAETYYAVNDMIPEGYTVIAAPPKTGKSWLMLDMCLKVARGDDFLGFKTNKSDTLYLALEDGDKFEQERLNIVCPEDAPENCRFVFSGTVPLAEGFLFQLDALVKKYPDTRLVVIDTLSYVQHRQSKGESAYQCDSRTGRDIKEYAEEKGIAIVVVTHTTKMIHAEDELSNVSGTNGVTAPADAIVVLKKEKRTDTNATMFVIGRKVRMSTHNINFNAKSCMWEYNGEAELGDSDQREKADREKEYLESNIRTVVLNIANTCGGSWKGRAGNIIEKAIEFNIGLEESNKQVGGFMSKMQGMFMAIDGVKVEKILNGKNGPSIWKIYEPIPEEEINDGFINFGEE